MTLHPHSSRFNWDDLRLCMLVARHGSVSAAATELGISHTTLLRRISALEKRLGVTLFRRKSNGYQLNRAGERFVAAAEEIEGQVIDALFDVSGTNAELKGQVVLSVPDISGAAMMPVIHQFSKDYPDISLRFETAQDPSAITSGNAHVALALTATAPPGQIGIAIGRAAFAVYVRAQVLDPNTVSDLSWIGLTSSLQKIPVGSFDNRLGRRFQRIHTCDTVSMHHSAIVGGLGAGLLACAVGDSHPDLVRVSPAYCDPRLVFWLLHRRELKGNARVLALFRHLKEALLKRRAQIVGEQPGRDPMLLSIFDDEPAELAQLLDA